MSTVSNKSLLALFLLVSVPALLATAAARPAAKPPATAPTDTAVPTDTAASDGSIQVTATLGAAPVAGQWTVCPAPGKFITCLLATSDALWVGTEDASLWRLDLATDPTQPSSWKQFPTADTRTDNIYGLAQDAAGRLWVGTQNQGVSVYNGKKWQNYGVIDGPIGEHVFSIAADPDPKRGTVWIATDHGLTSWTPSPDTTDVAPPPSAVTPSSSSVTPSLSYSVTSFASGTWRSFTRGDGLPADQIYAVTVAPGGRVWIGTECDGLAWSDPPYTKWQAVRADHEHSGDAAGMNGKAMLGWQPGLPSNLTNALLAMPDGTLAYSTDYGLALGRNGGQNWSCWQGVGKEAYENYFRGLAYDRAGGLWIATRQKGLVRLDPKTGLHRSFTKPILPDDYVFDVAVTRDGSVWAGTYGGGLARMGLAASGLPAEALAKSGATAVTNSALRAPDSLPLLPAPAAPPTLDELNAMLAALSKVPFVSPDQQPPIIRLNDDWLTKGDCIGRYGRYWSIFCATCSPVNYTWGAGPEKVTCGASIGPPYNTTDMLRKWIHWQFTTNPNSLELPPVYQSSRVMRGLTTPDVNRRQAEWDDHGEAYPMSKAGPGMCVVLKIPAGLYYLSLYNFNKDGHVSANRYRDFTLTLWPRQTGRDVLDRSGVGPQQGLACGRMRDFWGGYYERFLVRGPTELVIDVGRNHSFCTILAGIFLDLVDEEPVPYFHRLEEWSALCTKQEQDREILHTQSAIDRAARFHPAQSEAEAAAKCFEELERARLVNGVWWGLESSRCYALLLRWNLAAQKTTRIGPEKTQLLTRATTCHYQLGLYDKWEAGEVQLGKTPARQIEKALKWDSLHDFGGKGYETVVKYLDERGRQGGMHDKD